MFLENKYTKWYRAIISKAQADVNRLTGRFEKHHILPRSMGGTDILHNIVKLTPREHFICHLLLTKMVDGSNLFKMTAALNLMIRNTNKRLGRIKVTNRKYDISRFYSRVQFSEDHRRKISEAAKRRDPATRKQTAEANAKRSAFMKSFIKSPEQISKIADSQRGQKRKSWGKHSAETKRKISDLLRGKPKSEVARKKMSDAKVGRKRGPMSEEQKRKIGLANRGKSRKLNLSPEERRRRGDVMRRLRAKT